jgi:excisionase family DNA binding protein
MSYWSTGEVADFLSVAPSTVRRWIREGHLEAHRTPGGRGAWRVPASEVRRYRNAQAEEPEDDGAPERAVVYVRVRGAGVNLMDRILVHLSQYAARRNYEVVDVIRDTASGIDFEREGLAALRRYVLDGRVDVIVVERRDRLLLTGYGEFERWAEASLVRIEEAGVIDEETAVRYAREIVEDLFFPLADALALAADRTRAEQATARALTDVWRFLDVEGFDVGRDLAAMPEMPDMSA